MLKHKFGLFKIQTDKTQVYQKVNMKFNNLGSNCRENINKNISQSYLGYLKKKFKTRN